MTQTRLLTTALLLVLGIYALTGLFARPEADDLTFISLAHTYNSIGVLQQQYQNWQGRYGYSFMMGLVMPIAPDFIVRIFPALLILLMVAVFYQLLKRWIRNPLLAASGITLAFLIVLPDVWQSFFWYGSSTNYVLPFALAGGLLIWLLH